MADEIEAMAPIGSDADIIRFLRGDTSMLRCTVCGAAKCDCWTKCAKPGCSWSYRKGTRCDNPDHDRKATP
jgi:hypothetical protein